MSRPEDIHLVMSRIASRQGRIALRHCFHTVETAMLHLEELLEAFQVAASDLERAGILNRAIHCVTTGMLAELNLPLLASEQANLASLRQSDR